MNNHPFVTSSTHHGICTIQFYHPQSNALPATILTQLAQAIEAAGSNKEAIVIVLCSHGDKAFCAGASFNELMDIQTQAEGLTFFSGFANVINAIRCCPKLIIGRIQGRCVGGGVGIAAAVDYALATHSSEVKLSELAVGIGPFVVGPAVERKMGTAAFTQLAIHATQWQSSAWAKDKGLFFETYPTLDALDLGVHQLASTLAASSPDAMMEMKKIFWQGTENWNELLLARAAISGRLVLSSFTKNAIQKFKTK